jgi:hypothetical protein
MLTARPCPRSQLRSEQPHRRAAAPPTPHLRGIVRVLIAPTPRQPAVCTCGWRGKRRLLRSFAVVDALLHASRIGCDPAVPLLDVDIGQWP